MGFENAVQRKKERHTGELFQKVQPHDLLKFGIIPELVGRMPVITALQGLTREDLVRILKMCIRDRSYGVGVEKVFPVHYPSIEKIETVRHGYVRRAKLYYPIQKTNAKITHPRTVDYRSPDDILSLFQCQPG